MSHLTYEERCQIYVLLKRGESKRAIARLLNRSHSTIIRELKRNTGLKGYRFKQANKMTKARRFALVRKSIKMTPGVITVIQTMLEEIQSSPEQIAGRLKMLGVASISHETIYRMIWRDKASGGQLYKYLRHKAKKYNKRGAKQSGRGMIPNRVGIEDRPLCVDQKERFGDVELDTIVGAHHKGVIVSVVDRATKYVWLKRLDQGTSASVSKAITKVLKAYGSRNLIHTLTSDNGKEFAGHEKIAKALGGSFYFANPYHSWERGLNEHTNGLVRQYFPKGTNFCKITDKEVEDAQQRLNKRPRKALGFKSPLEAISALCPNMPSGAFHC